jgi:hypothetical protein
MAAIYALIDPRSHQLRYIGKALDTEQRDRNHVKQVRHSHSPKDEWLRELRAAGLRHDMIVIEECAPSESAAREKYWIARALLRGAPLLNMKHGGQGRLNTSAETRKRISEANKGKGHGPEWRAARTEWLRGRKASPETKAKMGRARALNQNARKWDYIATFPDGRLVEIQNVAVFCKEHGITSQQLWNFAAGMGQAKSGLHFARIERRSALNLKEHSIEDDNRPQ